MMTVENADGSCCDESQESVVAAAAADTELSICSTAGIFAGITPAVRRPVEPAAA